jgi:type IV pilus assembly protein PilB
VPIEYNIYGVNQVLVRTDIGMTFAAALRAFLRQDPNIIMVGEIRDIETGGIAIKAALTGHLVLSTLHTNDAPSTITRLIDMGLEPFNVAAALNCVTAQRLVRRICGSCKEEAKYSPEYLEAAKLTDEYRDITFYKGKGCDQCHFTGYHGRTAIVELWVPNEEDVILIAKGASFEEIRVSAQRSTFSMAECASDLLANGRTNLEELIRMLPYPCINEMRNHLPSRSASIAAVS